MEEAGDEVEGEGDREADDATADGKLEEKDVEEEREEVGDDTIVASATTPPRHASPVQQTATRSKSSLKFKYPLEKVSTIIQCLDECSGCLFLSQGVIEENCEEIDMMPQNSVTQCPTQIIWTKCRLNF